MISTLLASADDVSRRALLRSIVPAVLSVVAWLLAASKSTAIGRNPVSFPLPLACQQRHEKVARCVVHRSRMPVLGTAHL